MPVMWPRKLPPDILRNPLRSAECDVFRRLQAQLGDNYVVFYSRPWLGLTPHGEEIDGECDFVVCHPDHGLLAIEVKGGAVSYDPETDRWMSRDRHNFRHHIRNPVQQARTSKHQILKKLQASVHWQRRRIRARHAVILPDSLAPPADLGADMPRRIFCFREHYEKSLAAWIAGRMVGMDEPGPAEQPLGADGIKALERILALPFQLRTPLGALLSADDAAIALLTQQQYHALEMIREVPRAAISGGAGTGKTVLAIEEARRSAEAGQRTLYTCYNRPLADHVGRLVGNYPNLEIGSFHAICQKCAHLAGLRAPAGSSEQKLFDEILPELFVKALELQPQHLFDVIIVDEGQDFQPLWWIAIDAALRRGSSSRLRILYDSNQRVYPQAATLPADVQLVPIRLTWNLRNTQRIHDTVSDHYQGHSITPLGPEGTHVETARLAQARLPYQLAAIVTRLTRDDHVSAQAIAILLETDQLIPAITGSPAFRNLRTTRCDAPQRGAVIIDTVRRFKGLESAVVIVCQTGLPGETELSYVAYSRARTHLIVCEIASP
jgi:hypothetical protein